MPLLLRSFSDLEILLGCCTREKHLGRQVGGFALKLSGFRTRQSHSCYANNVADMAAIRVPGTRLVQACVCVLCILRGTRVSFQEISAIIQGLAELDALSHRAAKRAFLEGPLLPSTGYVQMISIIQ